MCKDKKRKMFFMCREAKRNHEKEVLDVQGHQKE